MPERNVGGRTIFQTWNDDGCGGGGDGGGDGVEGELQHHEGREHRGERASREKKVSCVPSGFHNL